MNDEIETVDFSAFGSSAFGRRLAEAEQRRQARIAEIGEDAYTRECEKKKAEFLRRDMQQALIKCAKIKLGNRFQNRTFSNFGVNDNNRKAYDVCRMFVRDYRPNCKGILLSGNPGIGKNHLVAAIVNALAEKMVEAFIASAKGIQTRVYDAFGGDQDSVIDKIVGYDVICVNDLGMEPDTETSRKLMMDLVDRVYEANKPLILTTNLTESEIVGRKTDNGKFVPRYELKTLSRLTEMCTTVFYKDYDHRVRP